MSLLDGSFAAFVNLDSRPDRHEHMAAELERVEIEAVRRRGLLPDEWRGDPERVATMLAQTPGALGCWMAQTAVMDEALSLGKHALVLEDDLVFCDDFGERMEVIDAFLAERAWDVFWLGGTFHVNPAVWHAETLGRDIVLTDYPRIVRTYGAFSTHAYFVRCGSIPKILDMLNAELERSVGIDTSFIALQPSLNCYAFAPGCVKQRDDRSNIGDGITYFSNFSKLGPHWFQPRMEDFDPAAYDWAEAR